MNKKRPVGIKIFTIGCLSILIIGAIITGIIGFKVWTAVSKGLSMGRMRDTSVLEEKVSQIETSGNISEKQMTIIKELVKIAKHEQTSLWGVWLSICIGRNTIKDEQITEDELQNIILVRDLLRENVGELNVFSLVRFVNKYPKIYKILGDESKKKQD